MAKASPYWTKQQAERDYRDGAKRFDSWFFSQSTKRQKQLREGGVVPYCETPADDYVFEVRPDSKAFVFDPWNEPDRVEHDTFYSREKVRELVSRILMTLSSSASPEVRLHLELLKIALRLPDALNGEDLATITNFTRGGIHHRVQQMRQVLEHGAPVSKPLKVKITGKKPCVRGHA